MAGQTDRQGQILMPPDYRHGGIKRKKTIKFFFLCWGRGQGVITDFFYKESKSTHFFWKGGGGAVWNGRGSVGAVWNGRGSVARG